MAGEPARWRGWRLGLGLVLLDQEERDFVLVQHALGLRGLDLLAARRSGRTWAVLLLSLATEPPQELLPKPHD
jgi:hypothetical protein